MTDPSHILALNDQGRTPAQIAAALAMPLGPVYAALREHRPQRPRAPRARTSELPGKVLVLHRAEIGAARIAQLMGVSRAYVYRIVKEAATA